MFIYYIKEYSEQSELYGKDSTDDFMEFEDDLSNFEEAYCGKWDSEEDFARHILKIPQHIEDDGQSLKLLQL